MKRDIKIPQVKDVYMAAVCEFNDTHRTHDWNTYIINDKDVALDMLLIVSKGFSRLALQSSNRRSEGKETSIMRHKLEQLPPKSYAKVEFLHNDVLALNNEFKVTFFEHNKMFEKTFLFRKDTINNKALQAVPLMDVNGVLVK